MNLIILTMIMFVLISLFVHGSILPYQLVNGQEFAETEFEETGKPKLSDSNLKITTVADGLSAPTTMSFVGENDILVLEKDTGMVKIILN
jgi:glucose/arabinose dehydrogenase